MKINKLIKYTSIMMLGIWMTTNSGTAFAVNEKVQKDVKDTINTLMIKDKNGTGVEKGGEIAALRLKKSKEIKVLEKQYEGKLKEFNDIQAQLKSLSKEAGQYKASLGENLQTLGAGMVVGGLVSMTVSGPGGALVAALGGFLGWIGSALENPDTGRSAAEKFLGGGSYTAVVEQIMENAKNIPMDESQLTAKAKSNADVQKALTLVKDYNTQLDSLRTKITAFLPDVQRLDQLLEEYDALPTALGAGEELYKYLQYIGTDENGIKQYAEYYFVMSADGSFKSIDGVMRGCVPLPAKLAEARSCIFCPLFKTIFNAAQNMSTKAYSKLADPLANVMLIGFSLVIAFMVLKNVSSFTKQDAPKFVTELLVNMFKVLIAFYMLKNANIVYGYIIGPVLKAGFEFGTSLLFAKEASYLSSCKTPDVSNNLMVGVMPSYLYTNLDCFIKAVQAEVAVPQSVGSSLMCVARNAGKESVGPIRNVLWDFGMMFQGLAIWIMGWIIALAFAFYLIDATIQLGIIGALMPFLIACWPFKVTRSYTTKGWGMFMNTFFVYVFMGLVVSINVELLGQGLTGSKGGFDAIKVALNGNNVQDLKALLDIGFSGFLVLVACCLFAFKLTGQASSLAGTMAGGGGPSIGASLGGLAYGAATKGVQGTLKTGLGAAKTVSDKTGLTNVVNKGRDWAKDKVLGVVGLGRRGGAAGNRATRNALPQSQQNQGNQGGAAANPNNPQPTPAGNQSTPAAQNQIKKMTQAGPRPQQPVTPGPQSPNPTTPQGGAAGGQGTPVQQTQPQQPQTPDQLRQQLENDYNNTANGRAGQQMMQVQSAEVARNQKTENEALGKMNYHNRRADDYLNKAQKASDPAQKKNFENLANSQFEEAVKAEAAYNKAKADTQKSQAELNAIKQENDRYKNQYVQDEMKKRNPAK